MNASFESRRAQEQGRRRVRVWEDGYDTEGIFPRNTGYAHGYDSTQGGQQFLQGVRDTRGTRPRRSYRFQVKFYSKFV